MDTYGAGFAVLWIGIWELVGLMWIYGFKNVSKDIALMIGSEPSFFWKMCWSSGALVAKKVEDLSKPSIWRYRRINRFGNKIKQP